MNENRAVSDEFAGVKTAMIMTALWRLAHRGPAKKLSDR